MADEEEELCCPFCIEHLDATDKAINYCKCGYQMCLWCWNQLMETAAKENTTGKCPNCRTEYDKDKITMARVVPDTNNQPEKKKRKEEKKKANAVVFKQKKDLQQVRVVQRNLVYAVGLALSICKQEVLSERQFFGQFGRIKKISVNRSAAPYGGQNFKSHSGSAYVTFFRADDAITCIEAIDGAIWEGRPIKVCFGTTKYCNAYLKGVTCNNPDCLYLHDVAEDSDSFTKEDMLKNLAGNQSKFFNMVHPFAAARGGVSHEAHMDALEQPTSSALHHHPGTTVKPAAEHHKPQTGLALDKSAVAVQMALTPRRASAAAAGRAHNANFTSSPPTSAAPMWTPPLTPERPSATGPLVEHEWPSLAGSKDLAHDVKTDGGSALSAVAGQLDSTAGPFNLSRSSSQIDRDLTVAEAVKLALSAKAASNASAAKAKPMAVISKPLKTKSSLTSAAAGPVPGRNAKAKATFKAGEAHTSQDADADAGGQSAHGASVSQAAADYSATCLGLGRHDDGRHIDGQPNGDNDDGESSTAGLSNLQGVYENNSFTLPTSAVANGMKQDEIVGRDGSQILFNADISPIGAPLSGPSGRPLATNDLKAEVEKAGHMPTSPQVPYQRDIFIGNDRKQMDQAALGCGAPLRTRAPPPGFESDIWSNAFAAKNVVAGSEAPHSLSDGPIGRTGSYHGQFSQDGPHRQSNSFNADIHEVHSLRQGSMQHGMSAHSMPSNIVNYELSGASKQQQQQQPHVQVHMAQPFSNRAGDGFDLGSFLQATDMPLGGGLGTGLGPSSSSTRLGDDFCGPCAWSETSLSTSEPTIFPTSHSDPMLSDVSLPSFQTPRMQSRFGFAQRSDPEEGHGIFPGAQEGGRGGDEGLAGSLDALSLRGARERSSQGTSVDTLNVLKAMLPNVNVRLAASGTLGFRSQPAPAEHRWPLQTGASLAAPGVNSSATPDRAGPTFLEQLHMNAANQAQGAPSGSAAFDGPLSGAGGPSFAACAHPDDSRAARLASHRPRPERAASDVALQNGKVHAQPPQQWPWANALKVRSGPPGFPASGAVSGPAPSVPQHTMANGKLAPPGFEFSNASGVHYNAG